VGCWTVGGCGRWRTYWVLGEWMGECRFFEGLGAAIMGFFWMEVECVFASVVAVVPRKRLDGLVAWATVNRQDYISWYVHGWQNLAHRYLSSGGRGRVSSIRIEAVSSSFSKILPSLLDYTTSTRQRFRSRMRNKSGYYNTTKYSSQTSIMSNRVKERITCTGYLLLHSSGSLTRDSV